MKSLSMCMIIKNEQEVLERCLKQVVQVADEIIIVDTGSSDKSVEIAKRFTNKVYYFKWCEDFSKARNYSFLNATCDYIMWLDADDIIPNASIKKINKLKSKLSDEDVVMLPYNISFDKNNNPTFSYYRERILKRCNNYVWQDPVHECIIPSGKIIYYNAPIEHRKIKKTNPKRNLQIYEALLSLNKNLTPRQQFYYAGELYYNGMFEEAVAEYKNFLKMQNIFIENKIQAHLNLARIYRLKKEYETAIFWGVSAFAFSYPKAELCCEIAHCFLEQNKINEAIFWYKSALQKCNLKSGAFVETESYFYIPNLYLAICCYRQNNFKKARIYNNRILKKMPTDKLANMNAKYYLDNQ